MFLYGLYITYIKYRFKYLPIIAPWFVFLIYYSDTNLSKLIILLQIEYLVNVWTILWFTSGCEICTCLRPSQTQLTFLITTQVHLYVLRDKFLTYWWSIVIRALGKVVNSFQDSNLRYSAQYRNKLSLCKLLHSIG